MTEPNPPVDSSTRNRNRAMLVAIVVLFLGTVLVAGALRFSGWQPEGRRNHGEMIEPPVDLREIAPALYDGGSYRWQDAERTWRILAFAPERCDETCARLADDLDTVWQLAGKDADRVHVLWVCGSGECMPPATAVPRTLHRLQPDPAVSAALSAGPGAAAVYLIDPNGFAILRYPPGFDPAGLRADLAKLLKLI